MDFEAIWDRAGGRVGLWRQHERSVDVPVCAECGCHGKTRCRAGAVCDVYGEDRGGRWDLPGDGRAGAFVRKKWFGV